MSNTLKAFISITKNFDRKLDKITFGNNRANSVGEGLELYVANAFNDFKEENADLSDIFSFRGSQNHPPDFMLRGGDAIEVKKISSNNVQIQLNSSHPKDKIYSNDPKITEYARECEKWKVKDLLYIIGNEKNGFLEKVWMVYGDCFVADKSIYLDIENPIKNTIDNLGNNSSTKELGRLNNVDPLKLSSLRIRGMWLLTNPAKYFRKTFNELNNHDYKIILVMKDEKFYSFSEADRETIIQNSEIEIINARSPNPNNPANLINLKIIAWK